MDPLEQYLQSEYRDDKAEIESVAGVIADSIPMFWRFVDEMGWPYELSQGAKSQVKSRSASTNSMMLFVLGQLLGELDKGALIPDGTRDFPAALTLSETSRKQMEEAAQKGFKALMSDIPAENSPLFRSETFGTDDPFTLTWALELLDWAEKSTPPGVDVKAFRYRALHAAEALIDRAFEAPDEPLLKFGELAATSKASTPLRHVFPLLRCVQLWRTLRDRLCVDSKANPTKTAAHFSECLHRHLSLFTITNSSFDIAELVFALEGLLLTTPEVRNIDRNLIERVFHIVEQAQSRSAYWRPLKPFVTTPQGHALLPLSVEIANSLLRICSHLRKRDRRPSPFSIHRRLFQSYVGWVVPRMTRGQTIDPALEFAGWHSEHVYVEQRIHPWETSQVLHFLFHYCALMGEHIADRTLLLSNLEVKRLKRKGEDYDAGRVADTMRRYEPLDSLLTSSRSKGTRTPWGVFHHLTEHYIQPRQQADPAAVATTLHFSALLYGPPGTGKSSAAEEVAKALDWELIIVTPSDFIAQGEARVEARAKAIFKTLEEQFRKVILLDEIDRMILDRDSPEYSDQNDMFQFMTPSMLVKLKDLRRAGRSIFMVGTNYEDRIDPAAKRGGRIDDRLMIAPPDLRKRLKILAGEASKLLAEMAQWDEMHKQAFEAELEKVPDLATAARESVLMTFTELKSSAEMAAAEVGAQGRANAGPGAFAQSLLGVVRQGKPAIRLASYETRLQCVQKPLSEFLALVYLKIEAGAEWSAAEKSTVKLVGAELRSRGPDVEAALALEVGSEALSIFKPSKIYKLLTEPA